jgi:hypothetical protein
MAAWPASLPQKAFLVASDTRQQASLRSEMDQGAPKKRKRFTAAIRNLTLKMILTGTQRATFDTFYITTINEGTDSFTILDPVDDATITVSFKSPPTWKLIPGSGPAVVDRQWESILDLEVLP